MMSQKLEMIINSAIKKANELKHEYLTLEGVFYAMLEDAQVREILQESGADVEEIREELDQFINDEENFSILTQDRIEELSKKQFVDEDLRRLARESGISYQPEISLGLQRVIQRAAIHVQSAGKRDIRGINLLVAMFQEKESFALYTLEKRGISRFSIVKLISLGMDTQGVSEEEQFIDAPQPGDSLRKGSKALEQYCINLNQLAQKGRLDPLIGRKDELKRMMEILCRRRKNNPLLVGEAGVGKTALAEGLASSIEKKLVPKILEKAEIYSLDLASLLAGAKFRGDFEERFKRVLKELAQRKEEGREPILFIDEMHTLMGAGATNGGSMDASNLLKPALTRGQIKVLGSTTYEEYRKFIEKDPAFNRRLQKVDVHEPSEEDNLRILKGLKSKFEDFHQVTYPDSVLKDCVDLTSRYLPDRKNPDKSLDVLDEIGASFQLMEPEERKTHVTKQDIESIVAKLANIPKISVASDEITKLKDLMPSLKRMIFGQDQALDVVVDAIMLSKSGLRDANKPLANFLFAGPTGVGKTELARQLAMQLDCHLERFDMSEYMEKHSVSKLIGAPPGYVGFDQGGLLTDSLKKNPHCVLLLDEIEKAHTDLYNILLQIMDYGKLTDSQGRVTDFRHCIVIMTTNAGAKDMESGSIGLGKGVQLGHAKRDLALKNQFSPEFRNRLDAIVHFNKLEEAQIMNIVEKFVTALEAQLMVKNVEIEVTSAAKSWLAKKGYDPKMGARPLQRLVDQKLKKPLSREILFGKLVKGGKAIIDIDANDELQFIFLKEE